MPTISQLPSAGQTSAQDEIPVSQAGVTRAVSVGDLLASTQPTITVASQTLLGRVSLGPGGPEPVQLGAGLTMAGSQMVADGTDHSGYPLQTAFTATDNVILNSSGAPKQMNVTLLRGLYAAGSNIAIDAGGNISASTDPSVTTSLSNLDLQISQTQSNLNTLSAKVPAGGIATLNASGQMTAPVAADISQGTISFSGVSGTRSMATRALDQVNVLDFGADRTGTNDSTAAFNAAFAALPSEGGEIWMPAGSYVLASPLAWANKSVALRGDGKATTSLAITHTGVGLTITLASNYSQVHLGDFAMVASNASAACAGGIEVSYPNAVNGWHRDTVLIENVGFSGTDNPVSGTAPGQTFTKGVLLRGARNARIVYLQWSGPDVSAGSANIQADAIDLGNCIDTRISKATCYYGRSLVFQSDYCEGIWIEHTNVVGTDYAIVQASGANIPAGQSGAWPSRPGAFSGLGLWFTAGEINTNYGAFALDLWRGGWIFGLDITREAGPASAQKLISLVDCQNFVVSGCSILGYSTGTAVDTGVYIAVGSRDASGNVIAHNHYELLATTVDTRYAGGNTVLALNSGSNYIPHLDNGGNFYQSLQLGGAAQVTVATPAVATSTQLIIVSGGTGGLVLPPADVGQVVTVINETSSAITIEPYGTGNFWGGASSVSQAANSTMRYVCAGNLSYANPNWFQTS